AVPQPFSAVGGGWYSAARSGHTPQLRLNELTVKSALDERTATVHPMLAGPPMLLRKSAPLVNAYPSDRPLTGNGSGSLYTETVVARGGPVAIKHRELTFERSPGSSFTVTNLTLLRNGIPIDRETYTISFYVSPVRYALTTLPSDVLASAVYIEFHQEEVVRRYNVYELRGTVNGAEKNDRLMIYSWRSQNRSAQMGQIQPMQYGAYPLRLVDNGTTPAYAGHILWSDLSEDPHSDQFFPRGSNDWMTDYLVAPDPERVTLHF
ncbi:MAG: hypothetical protein Q8R07_05910, partial [Candidatus Uhrbacteria bacterium]|nr:hypothetical protein [Candidatus Uhrbacteria bacterium]